MIYILPNIRNEQASWSLFKSVKCWNKFHTDKKKTAAGFPLIFYRFLIHKLFSPPIYSVYFCINFGKPNCTIKKNSRQDINMWSLFITDHPTCFWL